MSEDHADHDVVAYAEAFPVNPRVHEGIAWCYDCEEEIVV